MDRPRKQCRECLGWYDRQAGFALNSRSGGYTRITTIPRQRRSRCIACEQNSRDEAKRRNRWTKKARDTLGRHARKYKLSPAEFRARYSWSVERIAHDMEHAFDNTCSFCWKPYADMPGGYASVTIDIFDRDAEPFYQTNTRCCCPTCNTEKGKMTPEEWARRLQFYREHAENELKRKNNRLLGLPLFEIFAA